VKDVAYDLASLAHSHLSTVRILDLTSTMICEMQVSALASGLSGLGFEPRSGHRVVFSDETLYSHSACPRPGV